MKRNGSPTFAALLALAGGLSAAEPAKAPAKVTGAIPETALNNITLTAAAEKRLGIQVVNAERRRVPRARLFAGEVMLPLPASKAGVATQSLAAILPQLSPSEIVRIAESQTDADGRVAAAQTQLEGARKTLERAAQLLRDQAGSQRAVDDARTQVDVTDAALQAAKARRELLGPALLPGGKLPRVWVRVPIYAGDVADVDANSEGRVGGFSGRPGETSLAAKLVANPPATRSSSPATDFFYEVENADGGLRIGGRVGITLPLKSSAETLVIPWSAVVHDIQGGTWVYQRTAPLTYARQRVQVSHVVGKDCALASGVKPGDAIVTDGVAELFGTEFGSGK